MWNNSEKNGLGFTLLEGVVAIFLITIGVGAAYALISQTISSATISSQKLIASYLAQEGIEIVRNIRDTNWLKGTSWNDRLSNGTYQADYDDETLVSLNGRSPLPLNIEDVTAFYGYGSGSPQKFIRKITISEPATKDCPLNKCLNVLVEVEWKERGRTHKVKAQENLYNWR